MEKRIFEWWSITDKLCNWKLEGHFININMRSYQFYSGIKFFAQLER